RQWMSLIHVDDVAGMALWAIENETLRGPLNAVMPQPVTNAEFTREVARAVHRPAIFPAPSFILRLILGKMSSMLLNSARVLPGVAERERYNFVFRNLSAALSDITR
ncbi:MAG: DUF1731 domain-containing protein, partial [Chthoniobacterales bacterium]